MFKETGFISVYIVSSYTIITPLVLNVLLALPVQKTAGIFIFLALFGIIFETLLRNIRFLSKNNPAKLKF